MKVPAAMFQHLVESLPRIVEAVIDQLHINTHDFGMRFVKSRRPHTFGHVVYYKQTFTGCSSQSMQRQVFTQG
jgi:hypothetical protein